MSRCPVCRFRVKGCEVCERCGCDLTLLVRIELQADVMLRQAASAINCGQFGLAFERLQSTNKLKYSPVAAALLNFLNR